MAQFHHWSNFNYKHTHFSMKIKRRITLLSYFIVYYTNSIPLTLLHKKFQEKDMQYQASSFTTWFWKTYIGFVFQIVILTEFFLSLHRNTERYMDIDCSDINNRLFPSSENLCMCTKAWVSLFFYLQLIRFHHASQKFNESKN